MKKILLGLLGLLLVIVMVILLVGPDTIIIGIIRPDHDFDPSRSAAPPDYRQSHNWAALPNLEDYADFRPDGVEKDPLMDEVDVFFIHPTTYYLGHDWNDPLDPGSGTRHNTDVILANNASIFSDARVYAPLYRQATIVTFLNMQGSNEQQALALAYSDVERAFRHYLDHWNQGRPFILAGHSQGSYHGKLILEQFIDGKELADQMVAAYLLGTTDIKEEEVAGWQNVTVCDAPDQINCVICWGTYADGSIEENPWPTEGSVCVNPLTWRQSGELAPKTLHRGYVAEVGTQAVKIMGEDTAEDREIPALGSPIRGHTSARVEKGALLIEEQPQLQSLMEGNYHGQDLSLFHMDIRENAPLRYRAWLRIHTDSLAPVGTP
ncbi:MAG: DUF3089 domain-containing protein [Bacteroidota bacterium]